MKLEQKTNGHDEEERERENTMTTFRNDRVEIKVSAYRVLVSQVKLTQNIINIKERHKDVN